MSDYIEVLTFFPYGAPVEEARAARDAAIKLLWEKRSMLPEYTEELIDDILGAALPYFRFYPLGDNHHRAASCPYCTPSEASRDDHAYPACFKCRVREAAPRQIMCYVCIDWAEASKE
jgi:hypothetical protein